MTMTRQTHSRDEMMNKFRHLSNMITLQGKIIEVSKREIVGKNRHPKVTVVLAVGGSYGIEELAISFITQWYVDKVDIAGIVGAFVEVTVEVKGTEWNGKRFVNLQGQDIQPCIEPKEDGKV